MNQPLVITVTAPHHRSLGSGKTLTFDHAYEYDGVWLRQWDPDGELLSHQDLSYEEYEDYRRQHPELQMPELKPRQPGTNANGNTLGKVVGETPATDVPATEANPPVQPETAAEASLGTKVLNGVQLGLDVAGLVPGFGEIADLANAGISAARGDWVGAGLSLASAVPFAGWFAAGAKGVKRGADIAATGAEGGAKVGKEVAEGGATQGAKQADDVPTGGGGTGNNGGKFKGIGRCILRPYKPDTCKAEGKTGHHVVPDRAFRLGNTRNGAGRHQIQGGLSEADGLVICVEGATPTATNEHGKIHRLYAPMEQAIGLAGNPPGTAPLSALEAAGAAAVGKVTGCNPASLMAQLRVYHQEKGMSPDFRVRADERGALARSLSPETFGTPGPGQF